MPTIVVGADTELGTAIAGALRPQVGELRAFVSEADVAAELKKNGLKVAIGDVSDGSHVSSAALNTFCAVLVAEAAYDDRERSFAGSPEEVYAGWADALADAGTRRVIWVGNERSAEMPEELAAVAPQTAMVVAANRPPEEVAAEVVRLESLPEL